MKTLIILENLVYSESESEKWRIINLLSYWNLAIICSLNRRILSNCVQKAQQVFLWGESWQQNKS